MSVYKHQVGHLSNSTEKLHLNRKHKMIKDLTLQYMRRTWHIIYNPCSSSYFWPVHLSVSPKEPRSPTHYTNLTQMSFIVK